MEGDFNFLNYEYDIDYNIFEELPYGNENKEAKIHIENNFFNFLKINYNTNSSISTYENNKQIRGEEIIEKINLLEKNYSEIIISSPTQSI